MPAIRPSMTVNAMTESGATSSRQDTIPRKPLTSTARPCTAAAAPSCAPAATLGAPRMTTAPSGLSTVRLVGVEHVQQPLEVAAASGCQKGLLTLVFAVDLASYLAPAVLVAILPRSRPRAIRVNPSRSSILRVLIAW
jgi:hypothetical protein